MNLYKLQKILKNLGEPKFRYKQIKDAVFKQGILNFGEMTNISKDLAGKLIKEIKPLSFEIENILSSRNKLSHKALLKLEDGSMIETVFLSPMSGRWSACISSQVGCQLGCRFCATGKMGFKRDLTSEEITDQVLFWKNFIKTQDIEGSFSNIIFMGMGEPFLNWENVKIAIHDLIDSEKFNFGSRNISVSTSGVIDGIKKLAKEFPQVNLAISLIFPDNKQRSAYMPVNRRFNLDRLKTAIEEYIKKTNRKVFLEYVMFRDVNDQKKDMDKLIEFIKSIENGQKLLSVNLIRYNIATNKFKSSDQRTTERFKNYLEQNKIKVTIRRSLGSEIKGACGQLAGGK